MVVMQCNKGTDSSPNPRQAEQPCKVYLRFILPSKTREQARQTIHQLGPIDNCRKCGARWAAPIERNTVVLLRFLVKPYNPIQHNVERTVIGESLNLTCLMLPSSQNSIKEPLCKLHDGSENSGGACAWNQNPDVV